MRQSPLTSQTLPLVRVPALGTRLNSLNAAQPHPGAETAPPSPLASDLLLSQLKSHTAPLWHPPLPDPPPSTSDSQLLSSAPRLGLGMPVSVEPLDFRSRLSF